jgi:hypothetical protein
MSKKPENLTQGKNIRSGSETLHEKLIDRPYLTEPFRKENKMNSPVTVHVPALQLMELLVAIKQVANGLLNAYVIKVPI